MKLSTSKSLVAGLATLFAAQVAQAGVIFHTTQASFDAAVTTSLFSDFEGIVANTDSTSANPFAVDGVLYSQTTGQSATVCGGNSGCVGDPYDSALMASSFGNPLDIDMTGLGSVVLGAGGIFGDVDGISAATLRVFGAGNVLLDSQAVTVGDMGAGLPKTFFGWTTTGSDVITRIEFDMVGSFEAVDDMQFAFDRTATPEPGVLALTGLGLLALTLRRRRRLP